MFSTHSFNALLKTLEEPPEHVKFLLATTDPQKVPVTILSRCLQFNLKSVPDAVLTEYLGGLLEQENITAEPAALAHIARSSEGSVRDSLSLVEQAAAFGQGKVLTQDVESMLGRLSSTRVLDLLDSIARSDGAAMLEQVESLAEYSPDYPQLLADLLSVLHKVALQQSIDTAAQDADRLRQLSDNMDAADVQLYYQIGLHGRRDMPFAPDPREALEMTLLRMIAFKPAGNQNGPVPTAQGNQSARSGPAQAPSPRVSSAQATSAQATAAQATADEGASFQPGSSVATPSQKQPAAGNDPSASAVNAATAEAGDSAGNTPVTAAMPATQTRQPPVVTLAWTPENWVGIVEQLGVSGMPRQLANHCVLQSVNEKSVQLALEPEHEHLNSGRFAERLKTALAGALGRDIELTINTTGQANEDDTKNPLATPARINEQREQDALEAAQSAIRQDPVVKSLLEKVDGVVDESSVKPLGSS